MENKRSRGVTIMAWLMIIFSILTLLSSFNFKSYFELYRTFNKAFIIGVILYTLFSSTVGFISGIGILKLKDKMRKIGIAINSLDALLTFILIFISSKAIWQYCYSSAASAIAVNNKGNLNIDSLAAVGYYLTMSIYIFCIGLNLALVYFFTRPKVKEQFK